MTEFNAKKNNTLNIELHGHGFDSLSSFDIEQCENLDDNSKKYENVFFNADWSPFQFSMDIMNDRNVESNFSGNEEESDKEFFEDLYMTLDDLVNADTRSGDIYKNIEPTPIRCTSNIGKLSNVQKIENLPEEIKSHRDDFLSLLSPLKDDRTATAESLQDEDDIAILIHPYQNEKWMERYQDLVAYNRVHGHCNVPYTYGANPALGQWVKRQRHQYKLYEQGQHSHLTQDRIKLLEMLGFIWDSHGVAWEEKFHELKEFVQLHGHCNVPCIWNGTSKLSTWVKRQRRQYRLFCSNQKSTMTLERISRLEDLGLIWDYYGNKSSRTPQKFQR